MANYLDITVRITEDDLRQGTIDQNLNLAANLARKELGRVLVDKYFQEGLGVTIINNG